MLRVQRAAPLDVRGQATRGRTDARLKIAPPAASWDRRFTFRCLVRSFVRLLMDWIALRCRAKKDVCRSELMLQTVGHHYARLVGGKGKSAYPRRFTLRLSFQRNATADSLGLRRVVLSDGSPQVSGKESTDCRSTGEHRTYHATERRRTKVFGSVPRHVRRRKLLPTTVVYRSRDSLGLRSSTRRRPHSRPPQTACSV